MSEWVRAKDFFRLKRDLKMWESCLLLMLFLHPLLNALRLHFPWVITDIATHLSSSCLCPNRTSLFFLSNQIQSLCYSWLFCLFKVAIFLISQASEGLKITKQDSARDGWILCQHFEASLLEEIKDGSGQALMLRKQAWEDGKNGDDSFFQQAVFYWVTLNNFL